MADHWCKFITDDDDDDHDHDDDDDDDVPTANAENEMANIDAIHEADTSDHKECTSSGASQDNARLTLSNRTVSNHMPLCCQNSIVWKLMFEVWYLNIWSVGFHSLLRGYKHNFSFSISLYTYIIASLIKRIVLTINIRIWTRG